ncbi:MAG: chemotaxis protein CheW [Deltaproteobacteria bacterium]|nr:chemotaxis protein CheW [Deltaproteobacteria bacterium]
MPSRFERSQSYVDLATFNVGNACCGINILRVQEINKLTEVTRVPLAPDYVKGILNLRGQIITVIDVGKRLGLPSGEVDDARKQRNIIVHFENESIGLLVDNIGDVFRAENENIEKPPANAVGIQGQFFEGVFKTEQQLISILNLAEVLG